MEHTILIRFLIYMGGYILYIKGKRELKEVVSLWNFSLCLFSSNNKPSPFSDKQRHLLRKVVLNLLNKMWNIAYGVKTALQELSETSQSSPVGQTLWWVSSRDTNIEETSNCNVQDGTHIVFCTLKKFIFCSVLCHKHKLINKFMNKWMAHLTMGAGWKVKAYHCCTCWHPKPQNKGKFWPWNYTEILKIYLASLSAKSQWTQCQMKWQTHECPIGIVSCRTFWRGSNIVLWGDSDWYELEIVT